VRKDTRLNTNTMKMLGTLKSYAREFRSRETPKREVDRGLAPWWPPALNQPPRVAKEVTGPKKEEGEEKGRVMVLVVVMELMVGLFV